MRSIAQLPAGTRGRATALAGIGLLAVAGVLAVTSGAPSPSTAGPADDETARPGQAAAGVAGPVEVSTPVDAVEPRGVLTFTRDGEVVSVRADRPTWRVGAPHAAYASSGEAYAATSYTPDDGAATGGREVYPAPNGQLVARVHRDEHGVRLDVTSGGATLFTRVLAGPSDPELRGAKDLAAAVEGVPLAVAWSPDSRYLAAGSVTDAPWSLNIISTAGAWSVERHEVLGGYVGELAWSPDGRTLALSTYELDLSDHTVLLFDPRDRTMQRLLRGCSIVWSPDGEYLAVRREPRDVPGLWIAAVDGSALIRVADGEATFPLAWTPEG